MAQLRPSVGISLHGPVIAESGDMATKRRRDLKVQVRKGKLRKVSKHLGGWHPKKDRNK